MKWQKGDYDAKTCNVCTCTKQDGILIPGLFLNQERGDIFGIMLKHVET